jgi:hypothetical protein
MLLFAMYPSLNRIFDEIFVGEVVDSSDVYCKRMTASPKIARMKNERF